MSLVKDPAERFDAQRQRRDVEQKDLFGLAFDDPGLDGGAQRHAFHRVNAALDFLADFFFNKLLYDRHTRRAADENDAVDLDVLASRFSGSVFDRLPDRPTATVDQRAHQTFQFGAVDR